MKRFEVRPGRGQLFPGDSPPVRSATALRRTSSQREDYRDCFVKQLESVTVCRKGSGESGEALNHGIGQVGDQHGLEPRGFPADEAHR